MSKTSEFLIAGFGGQGVLFCGKFLVYTGMIQDKQISWLPSYGPEMRGGTANCSVIISDVPVGSPLVVKPTDLIAMNGPSLDKFEASVKAGGRIFVESSLIDRKVTRSDVDVFYVPATRLAEENDMKGLANMILMGKVLRETGVCPHELIREAMTKTVPAKKMALFDANLRAVELGFQLA